MGHNICALAIADPYDREVAAHYDLVEQLVHPLATGSKLVLFPIDRYWARYWQKKRGDIDGWLAGTTDMPTGFPAQGVIRTVARELTRLVRPKFAVLMTGYGLTSDYYLGEGYEWAVAYEGETLLLSDRGFLDNALWALGVERPADPQARAWDTIGLWRYSSNPRSLERYVELCTAIGA